MWIEGKDLEGINNCENLSQASRSLDRDSKPGSSENETDLLTNQRFLFQVAPVGELDRFW